MHLFYQREECLIRNRIYRRRVSILRDLGFAVETPTPTLVPIAVRERWVKSLSGISIDQARVTFLLMQKNLALKGRILSPISVYQAQRF